MASYSTLKSGSRGSEVSTLQELLNQAGYGLSVDGIFGSKTQQAVRDYQKGNGLSADGLVGVNTWGSLTGGGGSGGGTAAPGTDIGSATPGTGGSGTSVSMLSSYEGNRPSYTQSDALRAVADQLAMYESNRPGAYQSQYQAQIDALLEQINGRQAFEYDFNADPLYHQYKDQYVNQGRTAMMDTMGNAAGLTGGYGSSYASTAGQQAYQGYLQQLNNVIPDLYGMAYQKYRDDGQDLYSRMQLTQGLDATDYGRYRDTIGDYYNELEYFYRKHGDMSEAEYNRYLNDASAWEADRAYYYNKEQDALGQANWEREFAYGQSQDALSQANWEKEYQLALSKASGSGSSSGGSSSKSGSSGSGLDTGGGAASTSKKVDGIASNELDEVAADYYSHMGQAQAVKAVNAHTKYTSAQKEYILARLREAYAAMGSYNKASGQSSASTSTTTKASGGNDKYAQGLSYR